MVRIWCGFVVEVSVESCAGAALRESGFAGVLDKTGLAGRGSLLHGGLGRRRYCAGLVSQGRCDTAQSISTRRVGVRVKRTRMGFEY